MKRALQVVFGLSLFGVMFSGYLSLNELFGRGAMPCPSPGAPGTILGYPACVYGFFMFLAIASTAIVGLAAADRAARKTPAASGTIVPHAS
jgi:uncharacterized membrane protein